MNNSLAARLSLLKEEIAAACARAQRPAESVKLVAVTKTYPVDIIQSLIDLGVRDIGENKVQELEAKAPFLQGDYTLHMIGHLQSNKVNKVVGLTSWVQSVDSVRLLQKLDNACESAGKTMNILIEVNTSGEASKSGCLPEETRKLFELARGCRFLHPQGLMTVGPLAGDETTVRRAFERLRLLGENCREPGVSFELSMGMSSDFAVAIAEGATMVRIGSRLLGERIYPNHSAV